MKKEKVLGYPDEVMENYHTQTNRGKMVNPSVVNSEENTMCGDSITIYLRIIKGRIACAKFEGDGCIMCLGCANITVDKIKGMRIKEVLCTENADISNLLGVAIPASGIYCAYLTLRAIKRALLSQKSRKSNRKFDMHDRGT